MPILLSFYYKMFICFKYFIILILMNIIHQLNISCFCSFEFLRCHFTLFYWDLTAPCKLSLMLIVLITIFCAHVSEVYIIIFISCKENYNFPTYIFMIYSLILIKDLIHVVHGFEFTQQFLFLLNSSLLSLSSQRM